MLRSPQLDSLQKYLSEAEFEKVLGFTKEEWSKLDRYKKIEHKKRTKLF